jgi:ribosomal protein L11 methylase PrmA
MPAAIRNAAQNGVAPKVRFVEGDAAILTPLLAPVDLVLSNILRLVNVMLLDRIGSALTPGGRAIFAGMETTEAEEFRGPLVAAGFAPVEEVVDEGWWSVACRRG